MRINLITQSNWLLSLMSVFSTFSCFTFALRKRCLCGRKTGARSIWLRKVKDNGDSDCWWRYQFVCFLHSIAPESSSEPFIFLRSSKVKARQGDGARSETIIFHLLVGASYLAVLSTSHCFCARRGIVKLSEIYNLLFRLSSVLKSYIPEIIFRTLTCSKIFLWWKVWKLSKEPSKV